MVDPKFLASEEKALPPPPPPPPQLPPPPYTILKWINWTESERFTKRLRLVDCGRNSCLWWLFALTADFNNLALLVPATHALSGAVSGIVCALVSKLDLCANTGKHRNAQQRSGLVSASPSLTNDLSNPTPGLKQFQPSPIPTQWHSYPPLSQHSDTVTLHYPNTVTPQRHIFPPLSQHSGTLTLTSTIPTQWHTYPHPSLSKRSDTLTVQYSNTVTHFPSSILTQLHTFPPLSQHKDTLSLHYPNTVTQFPSTIPT